MTYNTHYPAFNEKGVPIDRYMKDMPQLVEDYKFMKANRISNSRIKVLSDLELITEEEAERYIAAQNMLELGLTAKVEPSKLEPDEDISFVKSTIAGFIAGVCGALLSIPVTYLVVNKGCTDDQITGAAIITAFCVGGAAWLITYAADLKKQIKHASMAKTIDLEKACVNYLIAARPLTEIKTGERTYNPEKEKTHDATEIIEAVKVTNNRIDKLYKHFSRTD